MRCLSALVLVLLCAVAVQALWFEVGYNEEHCFQEDYAKDLLVQGQFAAEPVWTQSQMTITIKDPNGASVFSKASIDQGSFALTTDKAGLYQFCFQDVAAKLPEKDRKAKLITWTGADAKDYAAIAKKDQLKPLEVEVLKIEEYVNDINRELKYLRTREERMRMTNESTDQRVFWYSVLSTSVIVINAAWQIMYLKRDFKKKKLI